MDVFTRADTGTDRPKGLFKIFYVAKKPFRFHINVYRIFLDKCVFGFGEQ